MSRSRRARTANLARALQARWYSPRALCVLRPLAAVYGGLMALRRRAYRRGWLRVHFAGVPVLVVGNITVGGCGKTPLVIALVERLVARGRRPGVIARGYGGAAPRYPLAVSADAPPRWAGDEPVVVAARTGVPVAVDRKRARAARWLVARAGVDCIVADDGLQHYALARDIEIAVVDARRGLGNRRLLPAGPLREPGARLASVDLVLSHGPGRDFWLAPGQAVSLADDRRRALAAFADAPVHAVAGIGDPARFFAMLAGHGLRAIPHPMPDHHPYHAADLAFADDRTIVMTEKDAVKCATILDAATRARCWSVPVAVVFAPAAAARVDALLARFCRSANPQIARRAP